MLRQKFALALLCLTAVGVLALAGCGSSGGGGTTTPTSVAGVATASGGGALDEYVKFVFVSQGGGGGAVVAFNANTDGTYAAEVPAGTYDVTISRPGYEDLVVPGFVVTISTVNPLDAALVALAANVYIKSVNCGVCHTDTYTTFRQTAHPYKISKVTGNAAPQFPYSDISGAMGQITDDDGVVDSTYGPDTRPGGTDNLEGTPTAWTDLTYVIGGYYWKSRFMDTSGYIVVGTSVQYNLVNDHNFLVAPTMSGYHNNDNDKVFNCGNCHTTGWMHYDDPVNPNRQDNLAGMDGTFAEQGIGCEACHGAGSTHAQTEDPGDITKVATPRQPADFMDGMYGYGKAVSCGECHTRDGERDYPTFMSAFDNQINPATIEVGGRIAASGSAPPYLTRHHEQGDEILGIDPSTDATIRSTAFLGANGHDCQNCHDPHKTTLNRDQAGVSPGVDPSDAACLACHDVGADKDRFQNQFNVRGSMQSVTCVECHMPLMAKSAVSTTLSNGVLVGDVRSHIFKIDLSGAPQFYDTSGPFTNPWLTLDYACRTCHYTGGPGFSDVPSLPGNWTTYHKVP